MEYIDSRSEAMANVKGDERINRTIIARTTFIFKYYYPQLFELILDARNYLGKNCVHFCCGAYFYSNCTQ